MRTRILSGTLIAMLAVGTGQAQASKAKAGQPVVPPSAASATQPAQAVGGSGPARKLTGRPADLDPRIPWLDDMGEPQSGGPDPFVVDFKIRYPLKGGARSIAEQGDRLAIINYVPSARSSSFDLVLLTRTGVILWSRSLPGGVVRSVFWEADRIYVIPQGTSPSATSTALVYDQNGSLLIATPCPMRWPDEFVRDGLTVTQGTAIWEREDGTRVALKLGDGPGVDPDNVILPSDLGAQGGDQLAMFPNGKLRIVPRPVKWYEKWGPVSPGVRKARARRAERATPFAGCELDVKRLPRYRPGQRGGLNAWGGGRAFVPWGKRGGLLAFFFISNPLNLPDTAYELAAHRTGTHPEFERDLVARFDDEGRMQGYLILRGSRAHNIFPQPESLVGTVLEGADKWLVRWVVARTP